VDASPIVRSYVRFNVDLSSEEVQHVTLLLFSRKRSGIGYQVRVVTNDWRENKITFRNAPRLTPNFVASGPLRPRAWKAVDVTSLVTGAEHDVSFALTTASAKGQAFASRETGLHGPRLVVETQKNDTTTATTGEQPGPPPPGSS
jgi:hypothetical protein